MNYKNILITGSAGFIGYHLVKRLISNYKVRILALDSINNYYDVNLKIGRLKDLGIDLDSSDSPNPIPSKKYRNLRFIKINLSDKTKIEELFCKEEFDCVINLAAQAGVRNSIDRPYEYLDSNLVGFLNILENCRNTKVNRLIFASSSSVYGSNEKIPFSESDQTDKPISLYAATKKSNELLAYSYSHLYSISTVGLRFFTVYGPWGRPDMAYYKFAEKILKGEEISLYNKGLMNRDFTYIDDIIDGIVLSLDKKYNFEIFNLGRSKTEKVVDMLTIIEDCLGKKAKINYLGMQPGDVKNTYADISKTKNILGYNPKININKGLKEFCNWYLDYMKVHQNV
tara:strand:- start:1580 stop:2602 length:1023 start_codon:yes stop_codon:yes gene_type:complete